MIEEFEWNEIDYEDESTWPPDSEPVVLWVNTYPEEPWTGRKLKDKPKVQFRVMGWRHGKKMEVSESEADWDIEEFSHWHGTLKDPEA